MTSGKCQYLPKIWRPLFKYIGNLWRARCYYVEQQKLFLEEQNLDLHIEDVRQRDYSILPPIDRRLFDDEHVPKNNSTSDLKKF